jgi:uncharacterized membrane protein
MSHPHDSLGHPRSEDDHVESRTVVLVGLGALFTFVVASLAAMAYLRHEVLARPAPGLPPELGQTKIALVEQSLFFDGNQLRGDRDRAGRLARLNGQGWVDRARGVAHIPVAEAMALVAAGARLPPSQPPSAPPLGAAHGGVDAPSVPIATPAAGAAPAAGPKGAPKAAPAPGGPR